MKKNEVLIMSPLEPGRPYFTLDDFINNPDIPPLVELTTERVRENLIRLKATMRMAIHPEHMQGRAVVVELKK